MNAAELDRVFAQTLADRRLSGTERTALAELLAPVIHDDQLLGLARNRAFAAARGEVADPASLRVLEWLEEVVKLLRPPIGGVASVADACFSPGLECISRVVGEFQRCKTSADVCIFTITDDRIGEAILAAHQRGVKVRIISDNDKSGDLGSDIERFERAGIPVRLDRTEYHMHHKFALFDASQLVTGSFNWTRGATEYNEENLIVTNDPRLVKRFAERFDKLWKHYR